jgi:hypothetical protein
MTMKISTRKSFLVGTAALMAMAGCATNYVHIYSKIDMRDRTIYVPYHYRGPGSQKIVDVLLDHGWDILNVDRVTITGDGNFKDFQHLREGSQHEGGYSLSVIHRDNYEMGIFSGNMSAVLSLVDNKTGDKVFTIAGRGDGLVREFTRALEDASENPGAK